MLLDGPNNENFESAIPYGTKLISAVKDGDVLIVDFTSEFLASEEPEAKANTIYSVVNTITELKEISGVKFLIEGKEVEGLNNVFARVK